MRRLILSLIVLLLASTPVLAKNGAPGLSQVVKALETPFQSGAGGEEIVDFQADFFQQSRLSSLDRVQRGRGQVAVKFDRSRPGRVPVARFRWDYNQPSEQEIVSDGKTMWVYLPENRQVIQSDIETVAQSRPDDPVTFLTGLGNLSRDFQATWASPNRDPDGNWILELKPRRPSPLIQRLLVVVDKDAVSGKGRDVFPILSTNVIDPSGNSTIIEFSNVKVNRGIPDSRFSFIRPAGVEVIRPTGREMGF